MANINVLNLKGEKVKEIALKDAVWNIEINKSVLHDALVLSMASQRQGTASTKTRSEVSGGGRKPWKQKGTGNARQGSTRSPQWPGGGIVFGPKPRSYDKKQNRKERRLALKSALTSKYQDNELIVVENFNLESNKTKEIAKVLENLKAPIKTLIVYSDENENLILSTRNHKLINVVNASDINVLDIINSNYLVIDEASVRKIEEVLE